MEVADRTATYPHDFRVIDNTFQLVHDQFADVRFLTDQRIVLILAIIRIAQLAIRSELELEELVSKFAFVTDVVAKIKIIVLFSWHL